MLLAVSQSMKIGEEIPIGNYRGFDLKLKVAMESGTLIVRLELGNKHKYSVDLGTDVFGNITRINNCLDNIEKEIPKERDMLDDLNKQFEYAKIEVTKDFAKETELKEKKHQLKEINKELGIKENEQEDVLIFDDYDEEYTEKEIINKSELVYER